MVAGKSGVGWGCVCGRFLWSWRAREGRQASVLNEDTRGGDVLRLI